MVDHYAALDAIDKGHDIEKVKTVVASLVQERGIMSVTPQIVTRSVIDGKIQKELFKDEDQGWFTSSTAKALVMYDNCNHIVVITKDAAAVRKCPCCCSSHKCQASDTFFGLWMPVNDLPDPEIEQYVFQELHAAQSLVTRSTVLPKICLQHELLRFITFLKFRPKGTPDYVRLAVAGFYCTNPNEMACYLCGLTLTISTWKCIKCPIDIHQVCSPVCAFLCANDTVNIAVFHRNAREERILRKKKEETMLSTAMVVERLHFDNISAFTQLFCSENKQNITMESVKLSDSTLNSVERGILNDNTSDYNNTCYCRNDHNDPNKNYLSRDNAQHNTSDATSKMRRSPVEHSLSSPVEVDFPSISNNNASQSKSPCEHDDKLPSLLDESNNSLIISDFGNDEGHDDLHSREVCMDFEHNAASSVISETGYSVQKVRTAITVLLNKNMAITSRNILNVIRAADEYHKMYKNNGLFICIGDTVCIIFDTCGHLASCQKSDPAIRQCPVCVNRFVSKK